MSDVDEPVGEALPPDEDDVDLDDLEPEDEVDEPTDLERVDELERQELAVVSEAHRAYLEAVTHHFGPDAPIVPCRICEARGYLLIQWSPDPEVERCATCAGMGVTATGSVVEGNETRPCPVCRGAGFQTKVGAAAPVEPVEPAGQVVILPPSAFPPAPVELPEPVAS